MATFLIVLVVFKLLGAGWPLALIAAFIAAMLLE